MTYTSRERRLLRLRAFFEPYPAFRVTIGETFGSDTGVRVEQLSDHLCAFMQPLGPPRITELAPRPQHITRAGAGGRRRCRPAGHPRQPDRLDASNRRLLKHEFADQDLPRRHARPAPGQIALRVLVPP